MTPTILITGATRGLGLVAARAVAARGAHVLVAGRTSEAAEAAAAAVGGQPVVLDLSHLDAVAQCAARLPRLDAIALNAGLQVVTGPSRTPDGFETTFQVNHLAQLLLLDVLLDRPEPPRRVVVTGSGTHDPGRWTGMPAPLPGGAAEWAGAPEQDERPGRAGRQRYTTSKLANAATVGGLARERPDVHVTCFDPGLMLGTGLARQYPAPVRRIATLLGPVVALGSSFASTPQASGRALARLLLDEPPPAESGAYVDFRLRTLAASVQARDPDFQDEVLRESRRLIAERRQALRGT